MRIGKRLFIPSNNLKGRLRFRFVRFEGVADIFLVKYWLDQIRLGTFKLRLDVARYYRD
jgi:hypothetical protein